VEIDALYVTCVDPVRQAFFSNWHMLLEIHQLLHAISEPVLNKRGGKAGAGDFECVCKSRFSSQHSMNKHKSRGRCNGAPVTTVLDIFMYFLAYLLGIHYQNTNLKLVEFLSHYVEQGHVSHDLIAAFVAAAIATGKVAKQKLYGSKLNVLMSNTGKRAGDLIHEMREWVFLDVTIFFTGKHNETAFWTAVRRASSHATVAVSDVSHRGGNLGG
jgi:hypothetical protein